MDDKNLEKEYRFINTDECLLDDVSQYLKNQYGAHLDDKVIKEIDESED